MWQTRAERLRQNKKSIFNEAHDEQLQKNSNDNSDEEHQRTSKTREPRKRRKTRKRKRAARKTKEPEVVVVEGDGDWVMPSAMASGPVCQVESDEASEDVDVRVESSESDSDTVEPAEGEHIIEVSPSEDEERSAAASQTAEDESKSQNRRVYAKPKRSGEMTRTFSGVQERGTVAGAACENPKTGNIARETEEIASRLSELNCVDSNNARCDIWKGGKQLGAHNKPKEDYICDLGEDEDDCDSDDCDADSGESSPADDDGNEGAQ